MLCRAGVLSHSSKLIAPCQCLTTLLRPKHMTTRPVRPPRSAPVVKARITASDRHFKGHYGDIDFGLVAEGLKTARVRQHSNPLTRKLQIPAQPPDWHAVYSDPTLPLVLDIGCGYGRFLIALATRMQQHNMLGLDIREPLIERGNLWVQRVCPGKVHFHHANATISLEPIFSNCPLRLELVTIQYPDPQFKKRHHKRRMVQSSLIKPLVRKLAVGGHILIQSDVKDVAVNMREEFETHAGGVLTPADLHYDTNASFYEFDDELAVKEGRSEWAKAGWLFENPLGLQTEREIHSLEQGLRVYRMLLVKTREVEEEGVGEGGEGGEGIEQVPGDHQQQETMGNKEMRGERV